MKKEIQIKNLQETTILAKKIGKQLFPGAIITLDGDLGAGKTTFTQGLAKALNITKVVNSPTFTIIKEYDGDLSLYHMDAYRIEDELEDIGIDEYFFGDGVCVIEWASKIISQIPQERLHININVESVTGRLFEIIPYGEKYEHICEELFYV